MTIRERFAPSDHYRYEYTHAPERTPRPPWTIKAVLNEGHSGSILNCPHPDCVKRLAAEHADHTGTET